MEEGGGEVHMTGRTSHTAQGGAGAEVPVAWTCRQPMGAPGALLGKSLRLPAWRSPQFCLAFVSLLPFFFQNSLPDIARTSEVQVLTSVLSTCWRLQITRATTTRVSRAVRKSVSVRPTIPAEPESVSGTRLETVDSADKRAWPPW